MSIFEIDIKKSDNPLIPLANKIRIGILKDNLEGDEQVIEKAKDLLTVIYGDERQIQKRALELRDYIDNNYKREILMRDTLNTLIYYF